MKRSATPRYIYIHFLFVLKQEYLLFSAIVRNLHVYVALDMPIVRWVGGGEGGGGINCPVGNRDNKAMKH